MRRLAGFAIVGMAVLCLSRGSVLGQPPKQGPPPITPAAPAASQSLSPEDEQQIRTNVGQALSQVQQLLALPMEQNLHELLDQGLSGADLPAPFKAAFVDLFTPYRQALHQFLDQVAPRLRPERNKPSGPRSNLHGPNPFVRSVLWAGGKVSPVEVGLDYMTRGEWWRVPQPRRAAPLWLVDSQSVGGVQSDSESRTIGDATETVTFDNWVDTPDSIADGTIVEMDITANPKNPVGGTKSGQESVKFGSVARVNRCPSADGKVPGKSEWIKETRVSVTMTTGAIASDFDVLRQEVTAEGHVGDDARLREVVVQVDWSSEKRVGSELTIHRARGIATFDPHDSEGQVPLQLTGCSGNQGAFPVAQCAAEVAYVSSLRDAYLRAERKWKQLGPVPGDFSTSGAQDSKCVIVKFTPPTRTVKGHPGQTVKVKAELLAVKGNQPTWGSFDELKPILEQEIRENGTRTSPGEPGELTYTAPSKPWPCTDPPGFGVYQARSRAGAIRDVNTLDYDDWTWFLFKCRLALHVETVGTLEAPMIHYEWHGDTRIPLEVRDDNSIVGQGDLPAKIEGTAGPCTATGSDKWTIAVSGVLNDKTNVMHLKTGWSGVRTVTATCPSPLGPMSKTKTDPLMSGRVATPLTDGFDLPALVGERIAFRVPAPSPGVQWRVTVTVVEP